MKSKLFAIFGNPVKHSKSPLMHNLAFRGLKYPACYGRYLLENGEELRDKIFSLELCGINITVPHKEYAYRACDELDDFAKIVGAVNTIVKRDNKLYGYNTDAPGFLKAIENFNAKRILFLGAGGTAQSTAIILRDRGYDVTILNRSEPRLEYFKERGFKSFTYDDFTNNSYDLIVNMTSAGLSDDFLPAPEDILKKLFSRAKYAVDVIYGKKTPFLKMAESFSLDTKDGADMLLYQGIIAFDYFTQHQFSLDEIEKYMKRAFIL